MNAAKRILCMTLSATLLLAGCGTMESTAGSAETEDRDMAWASVDNTVWNYNEEDNVYWQVGISYCETPASEEYETLGIFVPAEYMTATENEDGTYTCEINPDGTVGNYTAETAPIVLPVDTPGYSAMAAPSDYVAATADYTKEGMIYVSAGCRGREEGAPAGVTDLKAAIRYIRYNGEELPGDTERIFSFGMSGGGAQSALLGATGDSELYTPYLEAIGAVEGVSDAVAGAMCWCPITNLDSANEAYEWNMGVTRTDLDEDMQALSDSLAEEFAEYINEQNLKDADGNVLMLEESEEGIYQAGTYYDYLKTVVEESLNHFLQDTEFPYTAGGSSGGEFGDRQGEKPELDGDLPELDGEKPERDGELPELDGEKAEGQIKRGDKPDGKPDENVTDGEETIEMRDGIQRNQESSSALLSGTYETAEDYIAALNGDSKWISYDSATNTATITSIADFVTACKQASKDVGAFDALDATQGENILFGYGDGEGAHFDAVMAELLKDNSAYGEAYAEDLEKTDALGNTVADRLKMYSPMYYLSQQSEGYQSANVAKYWRIRSGINQGDTALTTEVNLALALQNYGVDVDFETVWGQAHVEAERTGDSTSNFIAWIEECVGE